MLTAYLISVRTCIRLYTHVTYSFQGIPGPAGKPGRQGRDGTAVSLFDNFLKK